jgi:hypothetical protein
MLGKSGQILGLPGNALNQWIVVSAVSSVKRLFPLSSMFSAFVKPPKSSFQKYLGQTTEVPQ